jgi:hypothetical protein
MRILGGEIECKIHTTAASYSDEQTHHWLIGGSGAITHNQILHIAATWSVTGNGKLAETQGNQTRKSPLEYAGDEARADAGSPIVG